MLEAENSPLSIDFLRLKDAILNNQTVSDASNKISPGEKNLVSNLIPVCQFHLSASHLLKSFIIFSVSRGAVWGWL